MIGLREDMGQLEHRDPSKAEPHQVAVGGKVCVRQELHAYALQLSQQRWNGIDAFTDDDQGVGYAETLP
jgi:hypothetical protein